jgi:hypothetical protein
MGNGEWEERLSQYSDIGQLTSAPDNPPMGLPVDQAIGGK